MQVDKKSCYACRQYDCDMKGGSFRERCFNGLSLKYIKGIGCDKHNPDDKIIALLYTATILRKAYAKESKNAK